MICGSSGRIEVSDGGCLFARWVGFADLQTSHPRCCRVGVNGLRNFVARSHQANSSSVSAFLARVALYPSGSFFIEDQILSASCFSSTPG